MPERIGRLLILVQLLIGYGKTFAGILRQQVVTPWNGLASQARFGTSGTARLLLRIGRALKLAAMPGSRLRRRTAAGPDVRTPLEVAPVQPRCFAHRSTTNSARRAAVRGAVLDNLSDVGLPSEGQIAAMIRRGRAGAIVAALCRDLGLVPAVVREQQWKDLCGAAVRFGDNFDRRIRGAMWRIGVSMTAAPAAREPRSGCALECAGEWPAPV
ncbi:MAG TPA: hypothetical protein VFN42_00945 [Acetobacteraceae bacterium]|nr:hypothetical protein [Acetobacteraceae bacterium]